jgi:hypothetical protein
MFTFGKKIQDLDYEALKFVIIVDIFGSPTKQVRILLLESQVDGNITEWCAEDHVEEPNVKTAVWLDEHLQQEEECH